MLTKYIRAAMSLAVYEILEDGSYYGEIPGLAGVGGYRVRLVTMGRRPR
jgi:hypothetical protein